jgi:ribonuclease D
LNFEFIDTAEALQNLCLRLAEKSCIAFDTEFVSEDRYRPQLCLIQVAAEDIVAIIDPFPIEQTQPFWNLLAEPGRTILAHAAREEIRFCYRYTGKKIVGLFDTQLAAGFIGQEFPASLANLVQRLVGKTLHKGETRTNWRTRPLTEAQLRYAAQDVTDLEAMYVKLSAAIERAGRRAWLDEESELVQQQVIESENTESWRRVSGGSGLPARQLEIIRQLWRWRDRRAQKLDIPPRRVLRDDLMVELAKRQAADVKKIRAIRGMEQRQFENHYEDIARAIQIALSMDESELPRRPRGTREVVSPMLSQFLTTSIACVCRQHKMAPMIVGNTDDVRELIGYELDPRSGDELPSLLQGWRGAIIGAPFRELLAGRLAIRVANVREHQPLEFIDVRSTET